MIEKYNEEEEVEKTNEIYKKFERFSTRKTLTAGFFDIALMVGHVTQLKEIITADLWSPFTIFILICILLSLLLQLIIAGLLIYFNKDFDFINEIKRKAIIKANNLITLIAMLDAILTIFITIFFKV